MERKEAIEVIKKNWPDSSFTMLREALETLIPELKESDESEDDKVRKEIISYLKTRKGYTEAIKDPWIAWLEKQGEQKPFEFVIRSTCSNSIMSFLRLLVVDLQKHLTSKRIT